LIKKEAPNSIPEGTIDGDCNEIPEMLGDGFCGYRDEEHEREELAKELKRREGVYLCICCHCEKKFLGVKRKMSCDACYLEAYKLKVEKMLRSLARWCEDCSLPDGVKSLNRLLMRKNVYLTRRKAVEEQR